MEEEEEEEEGLEEEVSLCLSLVNFDDWIHFPEKKVINFPFAKKHTKREKMRQRQEKSNQMCVCVCVFC